MKAMAQQQRPFQPVKPANNKYLAKRWDQDIFNTHREKVAAASAVIDNMPPTVHMHLHIKLKKLQFEAERLATIERDNRILLEKMAHVMRNGGIVDHRKQDYTHKSLNKTKRQRELLRITHENLAILKRLTTKDPHYNHQKWLLEWQMNQQYLMNISKYPHPWRQEQSPYITQTQRQATANKRINRKVHSSEPQGSRDSSAAFQKAGSSASKKRSTPVKSGQDQTKSREQSPDSYNPPLTGMTPHDEESTSTQILPDKAAPGDINASTGGDDNAVELEQARNDDVGVTDVINDVIATVPEAANEVISTDDQHAGPVEEQESDVIVEDGQ